MSGTILAKGLPSARGGPYSPMRIVVKDWVMSINANQGDVWVRDRSTHPNCWAALGLRAVEGVAHLASMSTKRINPSNPEESTTSEPDWEPHAKRFREKITRTDFWIIVGVHGCSLLYSIVALVVGWIDHYN